MPESTLVLDLLEKHGAELLGLFTRITLRAEAAEDLLQELFLKLRDAQGLASAANRKAYLFRAAMNLAFDWRRTQRTTEMLPPQLAGNAPAPLDQLIGAEEFGEVVDALQALSHLSREVLVLRYLQRRDYREIADMLGKTEHQVRALCAKALAQLRSFFRLTTGARDPGGT